MIELKLVCLSACVGLTNRDTQKILTVFFCWKLAFRVFICLDGSMQKRRKPWYHTIHHFTTTLWTLTLSFQLWSLPVFFLPLLLLMLILTGFDSLEWQWRARTLNRWDALWSFQRSFQCSLTQVLTTPMRLYLILYTYTEIIHCAIKSYDWFNFPMVILLVCTLWKRFEENLKTFLFKI